MGGFLHFYISMRKIPLFQNSQVLTPGKGRCKKTPIPVSYLGFKSQEENS